MKWALIALGIIDVFLIVMAGVRLATSNADTTPLLSLSGSSHMEAAAPPAEAPMAVSSHTVESAPPPPPPPGGGAPSHVSEITQTGEIATSNVQGNTEYNASKALDRASSVTDNRQNDLDDAKKKIGKIGK